MTLKFRILRDPGLAIGEGIGFNSGGDFKLEIGIGGHVC
jgi:hypothetical protein